MEFLLKRCQMPGDGMKRGTTIVTYDVNNTVNFYGDTEKLKQAWKTLNIDDFDKVLAESVSNATVAMWFLRQLCTCSRDHVADHDLVVIIEAADLLMPVAQVSSLPYADRKRCSIVRGWLSDPKFCNGNDTAILLAESLGEINPIVSRLPQVLNVEVPYPDQDARKHYICQNAKTYDVEKKTTYSLDDLAKQTAGLSLQAIRQLLCCETIASETINKKVEEYIRSQLGDDVVEFKRPTHGLKDVRGFAKIKKFIQEEMIPRFKAEDDSALPGAAVAGPIGGGKTYVMEAMAAELNIPVLVLKNLRSQWYGQTDVIFERLRRTLLALGKVMIFVDEADTVFGNLSQDSHETERRLTGKIQAMMSDPPLRGKVVWLLMSARIQLLSPDIRREGRVGDLIIPILDPEGEDRSEFLSWVQSSTAVDDPTLHRLLDEKTKGYSAAAFAAVRSLLKSRKCKSIDEVVAVCDDILPSDISTTRRYQMLQALMNCTRRSLMPVIEGAVSDQREKWREEIKKLEGLGIR